MSTVTRLPLPDTLTPEQALEAALSVNQEFVMSKAIVIFADADDNQYVIASRMDHREALWMAENFKIHILFGDDDE